MTEDNASLSSQQLAQERTDWAYERTHMAATRTFFALLRTGLAIAAAGSAIAILLASSWPEWVVAILAGTFIIVGFTIMISGLQRYHQLAKRLAVESDVETSPTQLVVTLTVILQIATVIVLILFLLR